jgi:hypothetical protein
MVQVKDDPLELGRIEAASNIAMKPNFDGRKLLAG